MCKPFEARPKIASRFDVAAVDDPGAINHTDDAAGQIVFAFAIHSWHLRRFAPDQGATGEPTAASKSMQQLIEDARLKSFAADVIKEEKRPRAKDGDVVHAVVHQIGAHGIVLVHRECDFQFRPDAIDARD